MTAFRIPPISVPVVDRETGMMTLAWYRWFEVVQGYVLAISTGGGGSVTPAVATLVPGNGLTGGGPIVGNVSIALKEDTGWQAGTGTANKLAFATYPGQDFYGGPYDQQVTDNAVKANAQRILAIEQALESLGAIGT